MWYYAEFFDGRWTQDQAYAETGAEADRQLARAGTTDWHVVFDTPDCFCIANERSMLLEWKTKEV